MIPDFSASLLHPLQIQRHAYLSTAPTSSSPPQTTCEPQRYRSQLMEVSRWCKGVGGRRCRGVCVLLWSVLVKYHLNFPPHHHHPLSRHLHAISHKASHHLFHRRHILPLPHHPHPSNLLYLLIVSITTERYHSSPSADKIATVPIIRSDLFPFSIPDFISLDIDITDVNTP